MLSQTATIQSKLKQKKSDELPVQHTQVGSTKNNAWGEHCDRDGCPSTEALRIPRVRGWGGRDRNCGGKTEVGGDAKTRVGGYDSRDLHVSFLFVGVACSVLLHRGNLAWHDSLVVQHEMNWFTG